MPKWKSISQIKQDVATSSAEEVTASYIDIIGKSKINGYVSVWDKALESAGRIDREKHSGPLAGVPVAIKDNISTAGIATTCASKMLQGYVPPFDAHVIEKLKEAGAIILGKTNMDEFAMGSSTESSYYGPTHNPWDKDRAPGGSSGGSAAVVAAGEAPISIGSDTGGSVRGPAAFCGVLGLKPTYGRVSRHGLISYANSLDQIAPIATCVADIAIMMDIISGHDKRDNTSVKKECNCSSALKDDVEGMRIGIPEEYFGEGIDDKVESIVWKAIHKFEDMGASWKKVSMPHSKFALASYYIIAMSEASSNLARFDGTRYGFRAEGDNWHNMVSRTRAEGFGPEVKRRILLGTYALSAGYYDKYYHKALQVRTLVKQDFDRVFKDMDVLMTPTMPTTAFRIGEKIDDMLSLYQADVNTVPVNLAGVPSISLPCGHMDGMPVGLQIIGKAFDENTILKAAYSFEQNTDHHAKRPAGVA